LDFTKYYIIHLLKKAVSKIRITDKSRESIIQDVIIRLERGADLFPDLKLMERVDELEEIARKLVSIYRRLNKGDIDLERISNQFSSDLDAIQSILYRFAKGIGLSSTSKRPRPKIVFDDTTFTFYEINDTSSQQGGELVPPHEKLNLDEFLSTSKQIVEQTTVESSIDEQNKTSINLDESGEIVQQEKIESNNQLIEQKTTITTKIDEKKPEDDLLLSFNFGNEQKEPNAISAFEFIKEDVDKIKTEENELKKVNELEDQSKESIEQKILQEEQSREEEHLSPSSNEILEDVTTDKVQTSETDIISSDLVGVSLKNFLKTPEDEYLEFETKLLNNVIEVDSFLNSILTGKFDEHWLFKIITSAYESFLHAGKLGHEVVTQLIRLYWSALLAIRDGKLVINKYQIEEIQSVLIIIVSLIKNKEIDLEPFWDRLKNLKEKLKNLSYEV